MSRSNTHYYNLCYQWDSIGEDGYCDFHRPNGRWQQHSHKKCIPPGEFMTRRGIHKRKPRFPNGITWKNWSSGPPMSVKKLWRRQVRAKYRAQLHRHPDDPELFDGDKFMGGLYQWWS